MCARLSLHLQLRSGPVLQRAVRLAVCALAALLRLLAAAALLSA